MLEQITDFVNWGFIATSLLTLILLHRAATGASQIRLISVLWLAVVGYGAYSGLFLDTSSVPPPFLLATIPPVLFVIGLFLSKKGGAWIDSLDNGRLTLISIVRIPVELLLYALFLDEVIPEAMTFAGLNMDILAGLTAPFIYYFGYVKKSLSRAVLISWNVIGIFLLATIVTIAVLSAPFPFQKLGFEQANIAVFYFPINWLPAYIVPMVFFSHFANLRSLLKGKS